MTSLSLSNLKVEIYFEDLYSQKDSCDKIAYSYPQSQKIWNHWFTNWLNNLENQLPNACGYELGLRLTDDSDIQALNYQYAHKNSPTDVLSFSALEVDQNNNLNDLFQDEFLYIGDIIISLDTAFLQAQKYQHSLEIELAWLASHGLLHLLGWEHKNRENLFEMLEFQETLLKSIGLNI